ncbi:adenosylcobinamide-phosphate synthase CbiB [Polynucleobacter sp. IMCC 30228]|uniref:adenosylcobinamide-phosphate synthase CbiB n=1 Tax=Polynucleobacter sp. IMCC 30228 TaxID=2781011 RepID=UPI001F2182B1|nr:adenosylcobinamide-phosphate synthase CbiB [Polynucleobacter sp. IMCC 30228]
MLEFMFNNSVLGWGILGGAIFIALMIDRFFGEPYYYLHPVVWMGQYLKITGQLISPRVVIYKKHQKLAYFFIGMAVWLMGAVIVVVCAVYIQRLAFSLSPIVACLFLGLLIKPLFSWAFLSAEVYAVNAALSRSLVEGRQRLAMIVSRDTQALNPIQVRESAIEALAENFNDSVIAPLFWLVLGGLPAAALYRYANTADAMWGYRDQRNGRHWEWAGKFAAKIDDLLSWIPARISGLLILMQARQQHEPTYTFEQLCREAKKTPSPNGGWPMGSMALALHIQLSKPTIYSLNKGACLAMSTDIGRACTLLQRLMNKLIFLCLISSLIPVIYLLMTSGLNG